MFHCIIYTYTHQKHLFWIINIDLLEFFKRKNKLFCFTYYHKVESSKKSSYWNFNNLTRSWIVVEMLLELSFALKSVDIIQDLMLTLKCRRINNPFYIFFSSIHLNKSMFAWNCFKFKLHLNERIKFSIPNLHLKSRSIEAPRVLIHGCRFHRYFFYLISAFTVYKWQH